MAAPNSRRPENDDSLEGTFREILRKYGQKHQDMLPAIVIAHDRNKNRVQVRPVIAIVDTLNEARPREEIPSIPVIQLGGGDFFLSFNIKEGDLGWIKSNDRDISLFLQSYKDARPNTRRMHNFSDAVFIPDVMTNYVIASEDQEAVTIQNRDGSVKIALDENQVRVVNGSVRFEINDSGMNIVAPGGVNINGATIGDDGSITSPVSVSAPSILGDSKELAGHDHDYDWTDGAGSGVTGENN